MNLVSIILLNVGPRNVTYTRMMHLELTSGISTAGKLAGPAIRGSHPALCVAHTRVEWCALKLPSNDHWKEGWPSHESFGLVVIGQPTSSLQICTTLRCYACI